MKFSVPLLLLLVMMTACSSYSPDLPELEIPSTWKEPVRSEICFNQEKNRFWEYFNDPLLNALEEEAIAANSDIKIAIYRIIQASSIVSSEYAERMPHVNLAANFMNDETLLNPRSFGSPTKKLKRVQQQEYSIVADFSYELDLWGKLKAQEESARSRWQATQWEYEFVFQTVVTEVAIRYFTLRTLGEEIHFLTRAIALRKDAVFLNQCRVEAGADPEVDLSRAKLELALAEVDIEEAKCQYAIQEHALATLLGKPASCWSLELGLLPTNIPPVPAVMPAEILMRRADVQQSLALLAADRSNVDVALRNYFPSFSLTTAAGLASPFLSHLFEWEGRYWSYIFDLFAPLYDGGKRNANLLEAKAQFAENFNDYVKTVNCAFQDVEDALADINYLHLQYEGQKRALDAASDTAYLSNEQFNTGLISYLLVQDAENTLLDVERKAISLKGEKILAWVRLMKALGIQSRECISAIPANM